MSNRYEVPGSGGPYETLYIVRGPGSGNYFITNENDPLGNRVGQAFTLRGAVRKARRMLRRRHVNEAKVYEIVTVVK